MVNFVGFVLFCRVFLLFFPWPPHVHCAYVPLCVVFLVGKQIYHVGNVRGSPRNGCSCLSGRNIQYVLRIAEMAPVKMVVIPRASTKNVRSFVFFFLFCFCFSCICLSLIFLIFLKSVLKQSGAPCTYEHRKRFTYCNHSCCSYWLLKDPL